jgi:flagellar basal-body rod modification protein FlgD
MPITATSALDSTASKLAASTAPSGPESEQRFLKLLVTQLNNQDPLNPLDNAQLTSQLAQMSTVSGIEKLNAALQALVGQSSAGQTLQAASMIGRAVLTPGDEVSAVSGQSAAFAVELPSSAESVKVLVTDAAGNTVRSIDLGALPAGQHAGIWAGENDAGEPVEPGMYRIKVLAANGAASVAATSLVCAQVTSVTQGPGGFSLDLATGRSISLSDVRMIL